jgi:hypothetical protein
MLAEPAKVRRLQASVMEWYRDFMTRKSKAFEHELTERFLKRVGEASLQSFAQRHYPTSRAAGVAADTQDGAW